MVDASAFVELLLQTPLGRRVSRRLQGCVLNAPAHLDAEVLSAFGALHRAGTLSEAGVALRLEACREAPIERHAVAPLLDGAWQRRNNLRLADALYVQLAATLGLALLTVDRRLAAACPTAELIGQS